MLPKPFVGSNKDLEITNCTKVVEALRHQSLAKQQYITFIYQNLGSFTFVIQPAPPLIEASDWLRQFHTQL